ncbi:putative immunoglobulin-like domain containing protein [Namao virus]|nr:putative immunoglobulin-like domain containing protein [Namao virus]
MDIVLTVLSTPDVNVFTNSAAEHGKPSTLACCVADNAKPAANINWTVPFSSFNTTTTTVTHENGTFTTTNCLTGLADKSMNQQKVFCTVTHVSLDTPINISQKLNISYFSSTHITVIDNVSSNITFLCEADANPPASYFWTKEKKNVSYDGQYQLQLNFDQARGIYRCESKNVCGNGSAQIYFYHYNEKSCGSFVIVTTLIIMIVVIVVLFILWKIKTKDIHCALFKQCNRLSYQYRSGTKSNKNADSV